MQRRLEVSGGERVKLNLRLAFEIARAEKLRTLESQRDELKAQIAEAKSMRRAK